MMGCIFVGDRGDVTMHAGCSRIGLASALLLSLSANVVLLLWRSGPGPTAGGGAGLSDAAKTSGSAPLLDRLRLESGPTRTAAQSPAISADSPLATHPSKIEEELHDLRRENARLRERALRAPLSADVREKVRDVLSLLPRENPELETDELGESRRQLAPLLGDLMVTGGRPALEAILDVIEDPTEERRMEALFLLCLLADEERLTPDDLSYLNGRLLALASNDREDPALRAELVRRLKLTVDSEMSAAAEPVLLEFARVSQPELRGAAVAALKDVASARALAMLRRIAADERELPSIRAEAVESLADVAAAAHCDLFLALFNSPNLDMRKAAYRAVNSRDLPSSGAVRDQLHRALATESDPDAVEEIIDALTSSHGDAGSADMLESMGVNPANSLELRARSERAARVIRERLRESGRNDPSE
jgi:HEAT repeat protein